MPCGRCRGKQSLAARDALGVLAGARAEFLVKSTGHTVKHEDEVHIWRFDDQGKVASFCHKVDSHRHWLALQPRAASGFLE